MIVTPSGPVAIGVIDVGSPKQGRLGWAMLEAGQAPQCGSDLDAFVDVVAIIAARAPLAIGFEAPMFIPTRLVALDVLTGRKGEGSRPWSASAGAAVTTMGLAVVTYTLTALRRRMPAAIATLDWTRPPQAAGGVLFFEAFVTGSAKGLDHAHDALIAAEALRGLLDGARPYRSAIAEAEVFNLLGASLLRTGWTIDLSVLSAPCLVVKPGSDHYGSPEEA